LPAIRELCSRRAVSAIGDRIALRRKRLGLSQPELAQRLGKCRSTVSKWETGKAVPRLDEAPDVARALGCSLGYLIEGSRRAA
jgi:transcriptional regulator with XRE-family HTH domain